MNRGKVDTLRSYDELVENANWQSQVREYLEQQNKKQVWRAGRCASERVKGIGGHVYWLF